ncbi:MAG TPA: ImmA/IrrE family metallo-endopeptidase [Acidimicrobiales bacterium]|nr:ImmA/IrrE family metallo-endopeptidase [Acidimicrobiales bacterium]
MRRFVSVPVFDISQTEGRDLPTVCERLVAGDDSNAFERLTVAAKLIGFRVESCELELGVNGECSFVEHLIKIERRNSEAQRVKSIAHELAHAILHEQSRDRAKAELEAESAAYIVCNRLGIDSGDYSFGYVASWVGDPMLAREALADSCTEISRAARQILSLVSGENR